MLADPPGPEYLDGVDSKIHRDVLQAHFLAELARDVDAIMATMSDNPTWLVPGDRVEGLEAGRALYEKFLPTLPEGWFDECLGALDDPRTTRWGETHCVIEFSEAYPLHRGSVMVVHFEGNKLSEENLYPRPQNPRPSGRGF